MFGVAPSLRPIIIEEVCERSLLRLAELGAPSKQTQSLLLPLLHTLLGCAQRVTLSEFESEMQLHDDKEALAKWSNLVLETARTSSGVCSLIVREMWRHCVAVTRPDLARNFRDLVFLLTKLLVARVSDPAWPAAAEVENCLIRAVHSSLSQTHHDDALRAFRCSSFLSVAP